MKKYFLAIALLLSTITHSTRCNQASALSNIAVISAISSIIGAYIILDADDNDVESEKKGIRIAFIGSSLGAIIGMLSNDFEDGSRVALSCLAGYGPAIGIMAVTKFLKNMLKRNEKPDHKRNESSLVQGMLHQGEQHLKYSQPHEYSQPHASSVNKN